MTPPQPGDRRPREGRCPDCDRPLSDEVYETRERGGYMGLPKNPVSDWWWVDHQEGHCAGEPLCDGERVDWQQRARDAEARALAADARSADEYARGYTAGHAAGRQAAYDGEEPQGYGQALRDAERDRDAAFRDGVRHGMLAAAWIAPDCRCDVSWTSRGRHSTECAAWVRDEIAAWAAEVRDA
jgi:hypothetical protein